MLMYHLDCVLYLSIFFNYTPKFSDLFQAHGRPSLRSLVQEWNKTLQPNLEHKLPTKMDAAAAFLASLEESKITNLQDSAKKPPVEILPPGMTSLYGPNPGSKKPGLALHTLQKQVGNQLLLEGPTKTPQSAPTFGNQLLLEGPTTGNQLLLEGPTTTPQLVSTSSEPLPSTESDIPKGSIMEASNTSDSLAADSTNAKSDEEPHTEPNTSVESDIPKGSIMEASNTSNSFAVSTPTFEQPDSTNAKLDVEPHTESDTSVPPVTESGDPNAVESDGNAMENQEQTSSTTSVPPASTSFPEPTDRPVAGSQELKEQ